MLPGDVVLAKKAALFLYRLIVEEVVLNAEFIALLDAFHTICLREQNIRPVD